jgi:1-phosphatidylinositol-4-phosphate 5-kinase
MYGIIPDGYLKSLGPENLIGNLLMGNISSLKEQMSTGKSGSFFYYTADSLYMLKTIS